MADSSKRSRIVKSPDHNVGNSRYKHSVPRDITEGIKNPNDPEQSEATYRAIFENSMDAILLTKPDGGILSANPAACKMFGWPESKIKELGRKGLVDLSDKRLSKLLQERVRNGKASGNLRFIRKDGSLFEGEISSSVFVAVSGEPRTIMVIRDLSDLKRLEDSIIRAEKNLRVLIDAVDDSLMLMEPDGKIIIVNQDLADTFGKTPEDLVGDNAYNYVSDEVKNRRRQFTLKAITEGKPLSFVDNRQDVYIENRVFPVKDADGEIRIIAIFGRDVTEHVKTGDALQQANSYNRSLLEASLDLLVTIGPDGKITDVNKATQEVTGCSRKELIGTDFSGYFTDPGRAQAGYLEVFSKGFVRDYALDIKKKNGQVVPVLYNATVYRDSIGNVIGVFAAARDISERRKVEERLKESSQAMRDLTQHLAEVSENERAIIARDLHDDLGQKLTALNMDISWLKTRIGVQSRGVVNKLDEMIQLLNSTIESTQKISYGLRPSILDDLGLHAAIEQQLSEFNKSTGIKYQLRFNPKDLEIDNKISLIVYRVIQEALTNVARHSKADTVLLDIRTLKNLLILTVSDNGIGIGEDRIKDPRSFGLQGMIERARSCGGEVKIEGIRDHGAVIKLSVPLRLGKGENNKIFRK